MKEKITDMTSLIGKNLRLLRTIKEMTIEEAASIINRSAGMLSHVENGNRRLGLKDLRNILNYYGYSLGRFFSEILDSSEDLSKKSEKVIAKHEDRILLDGSAEEGRYGLFLLRPVKSADDTEMLLLNLPPETQMTDYHMELNAKILGFVIQGSILIDFNIDEDSANCGETFCFDGTRPHFYRNHTKTPCSVLLMITPAVF